MSTPPTPEEAQTHAHSILVSNNQADIDALFAKCTDPAILRVYARTTDAPEVLKRVSNTGLASAFAGAKDFHVFGWLADNDRSRASELTGLALSAFSVHRGASRILGSLLGQNLFDASQLRGSLLLKTVDLLLSTDDETKSVCSLMLRQAAAQNPQVETAILEHARGANYELLAALVPIVPKSVDLVWEVASKDGAAISKYPSAAFLNLLSIMANNTDQRLRIQQQFTPLLDATLACTPPVPTIPPPPVPGSTQANTQLTALSESPHITYEAIVQAAVVKAKIYAGTTDQTGDLAATSAALDALSQRFESRPDVCIELLIVTSDLPSVRARAASPSSRLVADLVNVLKTNTSPPYGPLAIFTRLAAYPPHFSKDELDNLKLQQQSRGKTVVEYQSELVGLQKLREISFEIATKIADSGIFSNATRQALSTPVCEQFAKLSRELASHQTVSLRRKLAEQGTGLLCLYVYERFSRTSNNHAVFAAAGLARILASVPASTVFGPAKLDYIKPLTSLLGDGYDSPHAMDQFESLRALTNIASTSSCAVYKAAGDRIHELMHSPNRQLQCSAVEVMCNAAADPSIVEQFSPAILTSFAECLASNDHETKLAAAGGLAMSANSDRGLEMISTDAVCLPSLVACVAAFPTDTELMLRVLSCLDALARTEAVAVLRTSKLASALMRVTEPELAAHVASIAKFLDP